MKPPKTLEEQVEVLSENHGLIISDREAARAALKRVNYYHYRGYYIHWMDREQQTFQPGITFEMVCSLQEFDQHLRIILLSSLQRIELAVKSAVACYVANTYGPTAHLDAALYENPAYYTEYIARLEKSVKDSNELFIKHHGHDYRQTPIWAAIEVISFGTLSKMYRNLKQPIRQEMARSFFDSDEKLLCSYLYALSFLRNACAHCGRLYNKRLSVNITIQKKWSPQIESLSRSGFKVFPNTLFSYYLAMRQMLTGSERLELMQSIDSLFTQYAGTIRIQHLGFPHNWKEFQE